METRTYRFADGARLILKGTEGIVKKRGEVLLETCIEEEEALQAMLRDLCMSHGAIKHVQSR